MTSPDAPWRRLDARMLVVAPARALIRLVPVLVVLLITGRSDDPIRLWISVGITALVVLAGVVRWRTTQYRITPERVELHSGWVRRQRRSVPRDRIRTVDLTATPLHRLFRLNVVVVRAAGTGTEHRHGGLELDAVGAAEGDSLRAELLDRVEVAPPRVGGDAPVAPHLPAPSLASDPSDTAATPDGSAPPDGSAQTAAVGPPGPGAATGTVGTGAPAAREPVARRSAPSTVELARLHWSWVRFAPLTFSALAGVGAIAAAAFNLLNELGLSPRRIGVEAAAERLARTPLWAAIGLVGAVLLLVAVVGSVVLFVERWWGYRLTRESQDGARWGRLQVRRGLLTTRSLSVAEDRIRGVAVHEPLLLRAGRGAQARVLSTGLGRDAQGGALQPPAPRAEAHRVAAAALARLHPDVRPDPTRTPLTRHPPAATRRRFTRALVPAGLLLVATVVAGEVWPALGWLWPVALFLVPLAALLALDRARALGHALSPVYLVSRLGGLSRRTVALQRSGVIGWRVRQSPFQRRAGVVTLEAVTAAGQGGYPVLDIAPGTAVALIDKVSPGLTSSGVPLEEPSEI
ncbi:hypothetical protein GCM10009836_48200 [Pseudonocardia ailaonensis]|uniref:YdbS-like PH domain-containing protein n=1 Tax=Pseudonocardia ailaonensis TaxID=367279 RepID=A0ABN2ND82_9PSEU